MSSNESTSNPNKHTKNGLKIAAITAAAPAVTTGVITAAGFTTAGVVKGSLAASFMSKAAIMAGGSIAKGSSVAILQSIGATVLSPYLIPVAIVGGATAALVIYGPDLVKLARNKVEQVNHNNNTNNLT